MTEHTPGPWKAEGTCPQEGWDGWWVKDAEGNHIAEATGYQADETRQANAQLIAAAPDLLVACEAAETLIEAYADGIDERCGESGCMCTMPGNTPHSQSIRDNELSQLRAAIAKAKGEQ